ncbi:PREDICTED: cytochrome P450 78A5-like [Tarenaya hassleriana]|uniref:cytochrome P450 78A5-like n=1 Tax=Tarenaya hassleriana TaxID=28532 RepID=UPI00053C912B|nr:PREDICTED: cytochrome P450 78A5-like [Tarenaya hassleriana]
MDTLLPLVSTTGFGLGSGFGFGLGLFVSLSLFLSVFAFWLTPGGFAWGIYKIRTHFLTRPGSQNLASIPGPSGLPVLGLLFAFTGNNPTHRILSRVVKSCPGSRSLMAFSVGLSRFIVSTDPGTAKELLNSSAFADRPIKESAYELLFHRAMGFAPYGDYWRTLRRISAVHLFSPKRIQRFSEFRRSMGEKMIRDVKAVMERHEEVKIKDILHWASLSNVMMIVFGKSYDFSPERFSGEEGNELENLVQEGYDLLGIFNWSDHFPALARFDFQGVRRRCRDLVGKVDVFVRKMIEERGKGTSGNKESYEHGDHLDLEPEEIGDHFVDVLLGLQEENKLSDSDLVAVLWEMIFRGTDTVAILLEWILARMVLHPNVQAKARAEIHAILAGRPVTDSDLPSLPYLKAIVKETLRMHPPGPLLSWARLSIHDTWLGPHFVPAGTTAMVNMWAIAHDEAIWPQPHIFRPERFLEEQGKLDNAIVSNVMGSDLRLAPFGSGRRVCPGKTMGLATVELWLAQLLQGFEWVEPADHHVDLTEVLKLSMEMKKPLMCKAIPRV